MRPSLFGIACLVLTSSAALAQPAVETEIVSDPLPARGELAHVAAPAIAMARDSRGIAIAWAAQNFRLANTIYVTRLSDAGHVVGELREVPKSSSTDLMDASAPSISASSSGNGFTLGWVEINLSAAGMPASAVYCELDADLHASTPHVLIASPPNATDAPVLARSGKSSWIASGGLLWRIRADGSVDVPIPTGMTPSDMIATADYPLLVSGSRVASSNFTCAPSPNCTVQGGPFKGACYDSCRIYQYTSALQVVWLYSGFAVKALPFDTFAQPAVQSNGRDIIVVWFNGNQQNGGLVTAARLDPLSVSDFARLPQHELVLGSFGPDAGRNRPDTATDGERYLVVWRTTTTSGDHDVVRLPLMAREVSPIYRLLPRSPMSATLPSLQSDLVGFSSRTRRSAASNGALPDAS